MPVLPDVASINGIPSGSRPRFLASKNMFHAGRSLMEPVGLNHSSLANSRVPSGASALNSTSGVFPGSMSVRTDRGSESFPILSDMGPV